MAEVISTTFDSTLGRIAALAIDVMRSIATSTDGVVRSVCLSVGLSHTTVSPAKAAEPVVMLFGMLTRVGLRNHVLDASPDPHT